MNIKSELAKMRCVLFASYYIKCFVTVKNYAYESTIALLSNSVFRLLCHNVTDRHHLVFVTVYIFSSGHQTSKFQYTTSKVY